MENLSCQEQKDSAEEPHKPSDYDSYVADFLNDSRKYATRRNRSCHKRKSPMTEEEKKEENKMNSRNYTKRNREEIDFYRTKLGEERMRLENKCQEANDLFGPRIVNRAKETLRTAEIIMQNIIEDENGKMNHELVEQMLHNYEKQKKEVHKMLWEKKEYSLEDDYNQLKKEYEDLLDSKEQYISERGRQNFGSVKSRLYQRVLRTEMKRECFILYCAIENVDQKIGQLKQYTIDLKNSLWNQFLAPIDDYIKTSTIFDKSGLDYTNWKIICGFYEPPTKTLTLTEIVEQFFKENGTTPTTVKTEIENPEENKYSADSQISKAAENMDSKWTSKRIPWEQLIGIQVPEADNEITISSTPTSSSLPIAPFNIKTEEPSTTSQKEDPGYHANTDNSLFAVPKEEWTNSRTVQPENSMSVREFIKMTQQGKSPVYPAKQIVKIYTKSSKFS